MFIKKYVADTLEEAMFLMKHELGDNTVIINKKYIRKPGIKGLLGKKSIEVTVAVDNSKKDNGDIRKEVDELKNLISNIVSNKEDDKSIEKIIKNLEDLDVNKKTIDNLVINIKEMKKVSDNTSKNLITVLENSINISSTKMEGKVILVGPTGVGKTTTIAKIAGNLSFVEKKKVGIITIDTYRIGAVEQLKIYSEIMNIPFKTVISPTEMESAIDEFKDCDVILIDTTGRSCKNLMQISELRAFIDNAKTENIHLVVSCTTKDKDIEAIINSYKTLNFNNVIITKLDETTTYGPLLNILNYANKPLSYITLGQSVPDDILRPSKEKLIKLILGAEEV